MDKKSQTVEIRQQYTLQVPLDFKISSGTGDDTEFLQIYTEAGEIMIGYESGVEDNLFVKSDGFNYLKESFDEFQRIKDIEVNNLWMAYEKTQNKLRDIKGKIFLMHDGELEEIISFSCSSNRLNDVRQLIETLRKK